MKSKILIILLFAIIGNMSMNALTFTQEGITYQTGTVDGETVAYVIANNDAPYAGSLVIPENTTNANIPYKVYGIKDLGKATSLTYVSIPSSVENITGTAFQYCTSLENLRFEKGDTPLSIGCLKSTTSTYQNAISAFYYCPLKEVYVDRDLSYNTNWQYGYTPFKDVLTLESVTFGDNIVSVPDYLFYKTGVINIKYSNSIQTIGTYAFAYTYLVDIIIPNNVIKIGSQAFKTDKGTFRTIVLEDGIKSISIGAEFGSGLRTGVLDGTLEYLYIGRPVSSSYSLPSGTIQGFKVEFGNVVGFIQPQTIGGGIELSELVFGENLAYIGSENFNSSSCGSNLNLIQCSSLIPPYVADASKFLPKVDVSKCTLYVPKESIDLYKADSYWKKFYLIEGIDIEDSDKDDPNSDDNASIKARLYLHPSEELNLTQYITDEEINEWTCSNDDIVMLEEEPGTISALNFGEAKVRGLDSEGNVVAVFDIFVCPTVTVKHGDGVMYTHNVIYNSYPTLTLLPGAGYRLAGVTHDEREISDDLINSNGKYIPTEPISANSVINVSIERDDDNGPSTDVESVWTDSNIRIYVSGHHVEVKGAPAGAIITLTNLAGKELFRENYHSFDVIDSGMYLLNVEGEDHTFKILVN